MGVNQVLSRATSYQLAKKVTYDNRAPGIYPGTLCAAIVALESRRVYLVSTFLGGAAGSARVPHFHLLHDQVVDCATLYGERPAYHTTSESERSDSM